MRVSIMQLVKLLFVTVFISGGTYTVAQDESDKKPPYDKDYVFFGATGGASLRESENENALVFIIKDQQKKGYNFLVTGGYFLKPTLALGGAVRYDESRITKVTEDTDGITADIQEAGSVLTTSAYGKFFIPLTPNKRFNLYTIAGLAWVADRYVVENYSQNLLTRTYTNKNTIQLGLTPGIQVFVVDGFATEVGVNVAGFSGSRKNVTENGVANSAVNTFDLDLKINILSLNISFYYYFPISKK